MAAAGRGAAGRVGCGGVEPGNGAGRAGGYNLTFDTLRIIERCRLNHAVRQQIARSRYRTSDAVEDQTQGRATTAVLGMSKFAVSITLSLSNGPAAGCNRFSLRIANGFRHPRNRSRVTLSYAVVSIALVTHQPSGWAPESPFSRYQRRYGGGWRRPLSGEKRCSAAISAAGNRRRR